MSLCGHKYAQSCPATCSLSLLLSLLTQQNDCSSPHTAVTSSCVSSNKTLGSNSVNSSDSSVVVFSAAEEEPAFSRGTGRDGGTCGTERAAPLGGDERVPPWSSSSGPRTCGDPVPAEPGQSWTATGENNYYSTDSHSSSSDEVLLLALLHVDICFRATFTCGWTCFPRMSRPRPLLTSSPAYPNSRWTHSEIQSNRTHWTSWDIFFIKILYSSRLGDTNNVLILTELCHESHI